MLAVSCRAKRGVAVAMLLLAAGGFRPLLSQTTIVRFGAIEPASRAGVLEKLQGGTRGGGQLFCVVRDTVERRAAPRMGPAAGIDSVFLVKDVQRAGIDSARTAGIQLLQCGDGVPWIRDRAPRACSGVAPCLPPPEPGCGPTSSDYLDLLQTHAPYAAVHCGGEHLRFFFPAQFTDVSGSWSIERRPPVDPRSGRRQLGVGAFTGLLFGAVWANGVFGFDRDEGGYRDAWTLDKYTHGLGAGLLTFGAMTAGVKPTPAAVGVCAAGAAFEVTQGYVSSRDIIADCTGALTAWAWERMWGR